jgi:quercetin dioxygenase-like cupin family protein
MTKRAQPELPAFAKEAGFTGSEATLARALTELGPGASAPPQLLRERLLASVARPRLRYAPLFGALYELFDLGDSALADLFERAAEPRAWTPSPLPSTELLHLQGGPRVAPADNGLVRIQAGARFPTHRHLGPERVLVLAGSYRDEPSGRVFGPGDWHEMPTGSSHAYVALPEHTLLLAVSVLGGVDVDGFGTLTPSAG